MAVRVGNGARGEEGEWRNDNSRLGLVVKSDMSPEQRSPTVTFHINLKSCALSTPTGLPLLAAGCRFSVPVPMPHAACVYAFMSAPVH